MNTRFAVVAATAVAAAGLVLAMEPRGPQSNFAQLRLRTTSGLNDTEQEGVEVISNGLELEYMPEHPSSAVRAQEPPPSSRPKDTQEVIQGRSEFRAFALPFLKTNCFDCHGPDESKAGITLHDLAGDPAEGGDAETWEDVLEVLRSGEMPPAIRPQPDEVERAQVADWIDAGLRAFVERAAEEDRAPLARRLTNFEYQNTVSDLLGIELELSANLPEDPSRPYRFQNTADYLLLGLEQLDRYEENARRVMASVIVDPAMPEVHTKRQAWGAEALRGMPDPTAMRPDELGIFGNRNRTVANGMQVFDFPETGAFRIRVKASAILPQGIEEMPLQIMLGHDIVGVGISPLSPASRVGILRLTHTVDDPQVYELTGRIENFPSKPEHRYRRGGKIDGRLIITPPHFTVTPVNVYDDGTLNDRPDPLTKPRAVVEWMEFEAPLVDAWPPEHHARILFDSPSREEDPRTYVKDVLGRFLPRAFRRPVDAEEVERYAQVYDIVSRQLGLETVEEAMRETLAMVLISPDFLYHIADAGYPHHELASRLSYFLWGSMPDEELLRLADQGLLDDPKVVEAQARRMLVDGRSADFVDSFTTQWLALGKLQSVPIDLERFPRFLYTVQRGERRGQEVSHRPTIREAMQLETVAFVGELIRRNASLLELVESDFAMLNQALAAHYGVRGVQGHEMRPVALEPGSPLGGLLSQGSVLVATSTGSAPHPVYRAVWLREAILGDEVPDPPADVPALEDSVGEEAAEALTLKDLLRLHRQKESCRECHARLDPWGIPLEQFDATGRFRERVAPLGAQVPMFDAATHGDLDGYEAQLEALRTVVVEADATLPNGPKVNGVQELRAYLLADRGDEVAENVARRLLAYALGRELSYRDRYAVEELLRDSARHGHGLQDLILAVCRTDAFMGRSSK